MRSVAIPALLALGLVSAGPAAGAETVDLQLILAADVSRSVDSDEFRLQREGYAAAFTDPKVLNAIQSGPYRSIAVTFVEWSGSEAQHVVADWTVIRDEETAGEFINTLRTAPRSFAGFTSISAAIDFSMSHFASSGAESERRIIDVSGDGTNNGGRPVNDARDAAVAQGVVINGLAIINQHPNPGYTRTPSRPRGSASTTSRTSPAGPAPSSSPSRISRPSPRRSSTSWSTRSPTPARSGATPRAERMRRRRQDNHQDTKKAQRRIVPNFAQSVGAGLVPARIEAAAKRAGTSPAPTRAGATQHGLD